MTPPGAATATPLATSPLLHLSREEVEAKLGREAFSFANGLVDHPLTGLDALAELADRLPEDVVEHNLGNVPEVAPGGEVPALDLTPGEMVRSIETNGCWMVLPIHDDPVYAGLFEDVYAEVAALLPAREGAIRKRQGVFFLTAPNSTTPTHIDLEQGFLNQIRGTKELRIGGFSDRETAQREIEAFHSGGHRNVSALPADAASIPMEPGVSAHVPAFTPHVVYSGPEVSISVAFAFVTERTLRHSAVYGANARIRRVGLTPTRPGARPRLDRGKALVMDTVRTLAKRRSG